MPYDECIKRGDPPTYPTQPSVNPLLLEKIAQIMTKDLKKSLGLKISKPKKGSGRKR